MNIQITHNGFHGHTSVTLRFPGAKPGETVELSPSQIRRLSKAACGSKSCRCGESAVPLKLATREPWEYMPGDAIKITLPESGEVSIRGNYPQR